MQWLFHFHVLWILSWACRHNTPCENTDRHISYGMASSGSSGRHRVARQYSAEDQALNQIASEVNICHIYFFICVINFDSQCCQLCCLRFIFLQQNVKFLYLRLQCITYLGNKNRRLNQNHLFWNLLWILFSSLIHQWKTHYGLKNIYLWIV